MTTTKLIAATIAAAGTLGAGIALAAPAAADPVSTIGCSPCVTVPSPSTTTGEADEEPTFAEELAEKWSGQAIADKWTSFPGEQAEKWSGAAIADKWTSFPGKLAKKWGLG